MKKTLIALMALAGVAAAAPSTPSTITSPADYSYVVYEGTDLTLTSATVVDAKSMISNTLPKPGEQLLRSLPYWSLSMVLAMK